MNSLASRITVHRQEKLLTEEEKAAKLMRSIKLIVVTGVSSAFVAGAVVGIAIIKWL